MEEILIVKDLKKTFKLTAKQRKINKTNDLYKIAVDGLSFKAYKGLNPDTPSRVKYLKCSTLFGGITRLIFPLGE